MIAELLIAGAVGFLLGRRSKSLDEKDAFIDEALLRARQMHCPNCSGKAFLDSVPRGIVRQERLRILKEGMRR